MTHAEFHAALGQIAEGQYYSTTVEATTNSFGTSLEWGGYIRDQGWRCGPTPEAVIEAFRSPPTTLESIESIDPPPAPVEAVTSATVE